MVSSEISSGLKWFSPFTPPNNNSPVNDFEKACELNSLSCNPLAAEKLVISKAKRLNIEGDYSSLEVVASNIERLSMDEKTMDKLVINANKVEAVDFWNLKVNVEYDKYNAFK